MAGEYDPSWDRPHPHGSQIEWQESDCYWFYDPRIGVGGFHRIGQKVNKGTGQIMLLVFKEGAERFSMFDNSPQQDYPTGPEGRWASGQRVRQHTAESLGDGRMAYAWNEPESSATLEFYESFHAPTNWPRGGSGPAEAILNPDGHLEVGGRLRGTLRIGTQSYDIDALAHRDRSWGNRESAVKIDHRRYRMVTGSVGPELSFASFTLDCNDQRICTGHVIRRGVKNAVTDLRCITTFDADGYTTMGALALLTLDSGEVIRLKCEALQGFMSKAMGPTKFLTDTICRVECNGHVGFCDIEMCPNPLRGTYIPTAADGSLLQIGAGLTRSSNYEV
jgi:hypothetical protein